MFYSIFNFALLELVQYTCDATGHVWYRIVGVTNSYLTARYLHPDDRGRADTMGIPTGVSLRPGERVYAFVHSHPELCKGTENVLWNNFSPADENALLTNDHNFVAFYLVNPQRNLLRMTEDNMRNQADHVVGNIDTDRRWR